jgi:hypothetical protein
VGGPVGAQAHVGASAALVDAGEVVVADVALNAVVSAPDGVLAGGVFDFGPVAHVVDGLIEDLRGEVVGAV